MALTIGFDIYGTLIDTHGVVEKLTTMVGDKAPRFSQQWRDKQLEYTFRRGLMGNYADFGACTTQALDYTCAYLQCPLDDKQKRILLEAYGKLPVFADVTAGLAMVKAAGHRLYAFSNGQAKSVEALLAQAGILEYFLDVVSVDEVQSFKPDKAVYQHFIKRTGAIEEQCWLVSSNSFDVLGAMAAGMKGVWVQHNDALCFDPWGIAPNHTIKSLKQLPELLG